MQLVQQMALHLVDGHKRIHTSLLAIFLCPYALFR